MHSQPALHPTDQTLHDYALGRLDDTAAESVGTHLEGCTDCRRRVAEVSSDSFLGRLRDAKVQPPSQGPAVSSTDGLSMLDARAAVPVPPPASTLPPELAALPDYEILRELGQGGMGVVFLAQNTLMGRTEVLKVVSGHLVNRRGVLDRFLGEIRNAAKLHHPNIVAAYTAIRLGESLVLAMEYIEGLDLSRMVKARGPLPVANACNYIHQAALGLQHAHENGMVHRDIKPSNLMLAKQGNRAIVKVLDFGLAKVQSEGAVDGGLTHEGQMLGTPDYIAPEQISNARRADIRADIYSLGCTLYYLLTGKPPFQGTSLYDILQAHHSMDATPLNLVRPEVPTEVAAIAAKMMTKEPERRFQDPKEVAQALKPFFKSGSAGSVGPKPQVSQAGRLMARGETASSVQVPSRPSTNAASTPPAVGKAVAQPRPEPMWASLIDVRETEQSCDTVPAAAPSRLPTWLWPSLAATFLCGLIAMGIIITIRTKNGETRIIAQDDKPLKAEADGVIVEYQPSQTLTRRSRMPRSDAEPGPKSELTAPGSTSDDLRSGGNPGPTAGTTAPGSNSDDTAELGFVPLFNGTDLHGWKTHPSQPGNWRVQNGVLIGSGPEASHLYTERGDFKDFHLRFEARVNKEGTSGVFFHSPFGPTSPANDPKWVDGYEAIIKNPRGDHNNTGRLYPGEGESVFSNVEPRVVPVRWFTMEVIVDGNSIGIFVNGKMSENYVDPKWLYPSGHIVLQQHDPQTVIEFRKVEIKALNRPSQRDGREIRRLAGHENRVSQVAFSADGQSILSGGNSHDRAVYDGDGRGYHHAGNDNSVRLWETATGRNTITMREHPWNVRAIAFSPDGRYGASSSSWYGPPAAKIVLVWDLKTGRRVHRFSWGAAPERAFVNALAFSPDCRMILAFYNNGMVRVWDLATEQEHPEIKLEGGSFKEDEFRCTAFSADASHLVTANDAGTVELWDLSSGKSLGAFLGHTGVVRGVDCSADMRLVLSGGVDKSVRLWDVASGKELKLLQGHEQEVNSVALSPNGRRALSASNDSTIRLWDLASGKELIRLEGHTLPVSSVAFSPDGRRAVSGSMDKTVRLWQLPE
jgi:serine/threonine protein kinase/WD40 repeat protein